MNNVPWFWPGVLVSLVVGVLLAVPLGHAFRVRPLLAALLLVSFGSILAATLTPLRDALEFGAVGTGVCDFSRVGPPPLEYLGYRNDISLNIVLFIPLGLGIGLLGKRRLTGVLLLAAIALPFVIETIQLLVPVIARGCQSSDVIDNLIGLSIGLAIGGVARLLIGLLKRSG